MNAIPAEKITSYDYLKTFAVLTMVVDHIGFYFLKNTLGWEDAYIWCRAIGRLSFPVWLFLIGYSRSRDLSPRLMIGAGVLVAADVLLGRAIFPLNILFTILLTRMLMGPLLSRALRGTASFWLVNVGFVLAFIPTGTPVEYGSLGLIMAFLGYLTRHQSEAPMRALVPLDGYAIFAAVIYGGFMALLYPFALPQQFLLFGGALVLAVGLCRFRPVEYALPSGAFGRMTGRLCQFMGRHTFEIYVAHLLMFKLAAFLLNKTEFLQFTWI